MNRRMIGVVCAMLAATILFEGVVLAYGESPRAVLRMLFEGTWGSGYGIGQTLFKATPLLFTGLAVQVGLRAGLFNIGAEGQLVVASFAVGWLGTKLGGLPGPVAIPVLLVAAFLAGAAWALPTAVLRLRQNVHEVLGAILSNRIADALVAALLAGGAAIKGTVHTAEMSAGCMLPRLGAFVPSLGASAASLALPLALAVVAGVLPLFRKTAIGREIVLSGSNPVASTAAGVPVGARRGLAYVASGGLAGLGAAATVLGYKGYYEQGLGAGAGFLGLAVALLGRGSFLGLALAALLFGTLQQGGLAVNAIVPKEVMDVFAGVVIVAVAIADRWAAAAPIVKTAEAQGAKL